MVWFQHGGALSSVEGAFPPSADHSAAISGLSNAMNNPILVPHGNGPDLTLVRPRRLACLSEITQLCGGQVTAFACTIL